MKKFLSLTVLFLLLIASAALAEDRTINVAEGTLPSAGLEVPDPNIFSNLNSNSLKPDGWSLVSPHANLGSYAINIAALSKEQLLDYDLVFLTNHTATNFTNADRDKVQEWITAGGTLWIDDCGGMNPDNFFLNFEFNTYESQPYSGAKWAPNPEYYFFNNVYDLTSAEISTLGNNGFSSSVYGYDTDKWTVLVYNTGFDGVSRPDMIAMDYGEGRIIITADDYGCAINEQGKTEDYKLAYNILKWAYEDKPVSTPEPSALLLLMAGIGSAGIAYRKMKK